MYDVFETFFIFNHDGMEFSQEKNVNYTEISFTLYSKIINGNYNL